MHLLHRQQGLKRPISAGHGFLYLETMFTSTITVQRKYGNINSMDSTFRELINNMHNIFKIDYNYLQTKIFLQIVE